MRMAPFAGAAGELGLTALGRGGKRCGGGHLRLVRAAHGHAHALVLDLDLAHARLLHDLDELADPLGPGGVHVAQEQRRLAGVALADRLEQRLRLAPEHGEQDEILLAGGEALGGLAHVLGTRRILVERGGVGTEQRHGPSDGVCDRGRRVAVGALDELAKLVEHGAVPTGGEDVEQRLRGEDLADRRRQRRPAGLGADAADFGQGVEQAVAGGMGAQVDVERCDEPGREVVLDGAHGDPGGDRGDGLVADVLVDHVGRLPHGCRVGAGGAVEAVQRFDEGLAADAVQGQCERVDGGRDEVGFDPGGDQRVREAGAGGSLDVEADREPGRLLQAHDQLLGEVRQQRAGRVVDDDPRGAELGDLLRLLDERLHLSAAPGAVHEPGVEDLAGVDDRLSGLTQVGDVVERIVQPEDVDAVVGGAGDEAPHDVRGDGPGADEEAAAERDPERGRGARVERADPLPRALDAAAHRRVEDAPARHLEAREAGPIEDLGDVQHLAGGHLAGEWLLREQADGRVDELWHDCGGTLARRLVV